MPFGRCSLFSCCGRSFWRLAACQELDDGTQEYGQARGLDVMVYAVLCRHSRSKEEYWAENLGIG